MVSKEWIGDLGDLFFDLEHSQDEPVDRSDGARSKDEVLEEIKEKLGEIKPKVTREWVENLVSDLNESYLEIGGKPGYQVLGDAFHYLGVKVEK